MRAILYHLEHGNRENQEKVMKKRNGSVLIFVSMTFILIPEAGCGQSPQSLVNTGNSVNSLCWKS
jgi:hypothetical protein